MEAKLLIIGSYTAEEIAKDQRACTMVDHVIMQDRVNQMICRTSNHDVLLASEDDNQNPIMASENDNHDVEKGIKVSENDDHNVGKAIMVTANDDDNVGKAIMVTANDDDNVGKAIMVTENDTCSLVNGIEMSENGKYAVEKAKVVSRNGNHNLDEVIMVSETNNHNAEKLVMVSNGDDHDDIQGPDMEHIELNVVIVLKDDLKEDESECRVCHLTFTESHMSETIQLGCHCKDSLALAHRNCAEAWFKIKGNRVCEICGAPARNILGVEDSGFMEQWNDLGAENTTMDQQRDCWQSLSLCNFLLACMVVIFILLWLFRISIS